MINDGVLSFSFFLKGLTSIFLVFNVSLIYVYNMYISGVSTPLILILENEINDLNKLINSFNKLACHLDIKSKHGEDYRYLLNNGLTFDLTNNYKQDVSNKFFNIINEHNPKNSSCFIDLIEFNIKQ
jgi:hypothetical protein